MCCHPGYSGTYGAVDVKDTKDCMLMRACNRLQIFGEVPFVKFVPWCCTCRKNHQIWVNELNNVVMIM